jgi:hypothetical protein
MPTQTVRVLFDVSITCIWGPWEMHDATDSPKHDLAPVFPKKLYVSHSYPSEPRSSTRSNLVPPAAPRRTQVWCLPQTATRSRPKVSHQISAGVRLDPSDAGQSPCRSPLITFSTPGHPPGTPPRTATLVDSRRQWAQPTPPCPRVHDAGKVNYLSFSHGWFAAVNVVRDRSEPVQISLWSFGYRIKERSY